jgi:hypothetical protein
MTDTEPLPSNGLLLALQFWLSANMSIRYATLLIHTFAPKCMAQIPLAEDRTGGELLWPLTLLRSGPSPGRFEALTCALAIGVNLDTSEYPVASVAKVK